MNHTETWCVALSCLLVTEPLPESATTTVLHHPLRAHGLLPSQHTPAARYPLHCGTGVGTSSSCCSFQGRSR